MIKNIKQFFTINIGWKIFALLTAFTLWCIVINMTNPTETKEFIVNMEIVGKENLVASNIVLANEASLKNMRVTIKVRGNRLGLEKLKANGKNIIGTVDLQSDMLYSMGIGKINKVLVDVKLPILGGENFEIVERSPQYVEVVLEKIETVQKPITVVLLGNTKEGFVTLKPQQIPSTIQIKGASSAIAKIDVVKAPVSVEGASADIDISVEPRVYDAEDKEILGLELSYKYISVKVPINEYKKVPIDGSANQGLLQDGYTVTNIDWEPKFVEVVGSSIEVNAFADLKLPAVNLSGLNKTKEIIYDITSLLPAKVNVREGTPSDVKIIITIEKEVVNEFSIPIENITVNGFTSSTEQYKISQKPVKLRLRGLGDIINTVSVSSIKGSIEIGRYGEGIYDVPVSFTLPKGVTLEGSAPTVNITISQLATEVPSTTETPSTPPTPSTSSKPSTTTNTIEATSRETQASSNATDSTEKD